MKKILISLFLLLSLLSPLTVAANGADLRLSAESAVIMASDTGEIIFEKNAYQKRPMASTTKIMTALVVIEACDLEKSFSVSAEAVGAEGTSAYLSKNDTLTFESALIALLLQSANDAANALAIEVGDSIEGFAALMNEKAKEIGLEDTCFKNPSGLPADGHYTTANDLALLASVCLRNSDFSRIVSMKRATVMINGESRTFVNHNKLLTLYEGANGVKTGFTKESGRCLVGSCERDGVNLLTVTLDASDDWNDHRKMFDYGFAKLRSYQLYSEESFIIELPVAGTGKCIKVAPKGKKSTVLPYDRKISVAIEAPSLICAPVNLGDKIGTAVFYCNGREIARTSLFALSRVT